MHDIPLKRSHSDLLSLRNIMVRTLPHHPNAQTAPHKPASRVYLFNLGQPVVLES
jgi:hypothetical protein